MYTKSTSISKTTLINAQNAGESINLFIGNNSSDQIENANTILWYGTGAVPSYTYSKCWVVPATASEQGNGSTLPEIIQAMTTEGVESVSFTVRNETNDVINHTGTVAVFLFAQREMDDWGSCVS